MQKRISIPLFFVGFFLISFAQAQVKIGDNPQTIDPASILELESSDKVLVITRVDSLQMTTIVPNRGALVYNTTADCVYYYDGAAWISMCEGADGGAHTATPIVNSQSTIVITPTEGGNNFEIAPNSITSDQILNGGINGVDIQNGSIGRGKLAPNAVDKARIAQNAVGPYAIDRDSLPLSFFNNDAGFITGANVVSGDADNSISVGSDSGAFFDATFIEDNIAANTAAIAADGDGNALNEIQILNLNGATNELTLSRGGGSVILPTSSGSDTKIANGTNTTVTGTGVTGNEYQINVTADGDGSATNELQDLSYNVTTKILTITNPATAGNEIDLSGLDGGTGTTQNAAQVPFTATGNTVSTNVQDALVEIQTEVDGITAGGEVNTSSSPGTGGVPVALPKSGVDLPFKRINAADTGFISVTDDIADNQIDIAIKPAVALATPTNQMLITNKDTDLVAWAPVPDGLTPVTDTDDDDGLSNYDTDNGYDINVDDATIEIHTDDNLRIKPAVPLPTPADQMLITNSTTNEVEWAPLAPHTGEPQSIFYADENGIPTTAFNPNGGGTKETKPSLIWDQSKRVNSGALGVGIDGGPFGDHAKVVIMEDIPGDLAYPLQIQNRGTDNNGSAAGILFAVERSGDFGKGALVYERVSPLPGWGRGDFHFLQEPNEGNALPSLANKAFTVKNNGDIVLYKGIEIGGVLGDDGQVLTSTGTGVAWEDPEEGALPSGGTADQVLLTDGTTRAWTTLNGTQVNLDGTFDIDSDGTNESTVEAAITALASISGGENISNKDLTQITGEDRKYNLNNQTLYFDGPGNIGIGQFDFDDTTPTIPNQAENKLDVIGQISARDGFAASPGSEGQPSYGFYTSGDTNTGMFRATEDQIGLSTGGTEALRINASQNIGIGETAPDQKLHVNGNIKIDNGDIIARNGAGNQGDILKTTITGTEWAQPDIAHKGKILAGTKTVNFPDMGGTDYIIQTTLIDNSFGLPAMIKVTNQTATSFTVEIYQFMPGTPDDPSTSAINESTPSDFVITDLDWFYTIIRP